MGSGTQLNSATSRHWRPMSCSPMRGTASAWQVAGAWVDNDTLSSNALIEEMNSKRFVEPIPALIMYTSTPMIPVVPILVVPRFLYKISTEIIDLL